ATAKRRCATCSNAGSGRATRRHDEKRTTEAARVLQHSPPCSLPLHAPRHSVVAASMGGMTMITKLVFTCLAGVGLVAETAPPQNPAAPPKESLAQNQAQLRTYSWVETTQVSLKGEVKKTEQKQCFYGAD